VVVLALRMSSETEHPVDGWLFVLSEEEEEKARMGAGGGIKRHMFGCVFMRIKHRLSTK
jgi:hypothetical protein